MLSSFCCIEKVQIVEVKADGSRRAFGPGELIRFDLKSDNGPATFKGVACFLGTSR
jgi:hypothetical protein